MTQDTATCVEISPKHTTTYTMPLATYNLVKDVMDAWPYTHGRRFKRTIARALAVIERAVPGSRKGVTMKRRINPPEIRGFGTSFVWYDPPVTP